MFPPPFDPAHLCVGKSMTTTSYMDEVASLVSMYTSMENNEYELWTVCTITMRPSGSAQGKFYYLSPDSKRIIHHRYFTTLPMPSSVISIIHAMSTKPKFHAGIKILHNNNIPITPTITYDDAPNNTTANSNGVGENVDDNSVDNENEDLDPNIPYWE